MFRVHSAPSRHQAVERHGDVSELAEEEQADPRCVAHYVDNNAFVPAKGALVEHTGCSGLPCRLRLRVTQGLFGRLQHLDDANPRILWAMPVERFGSFVAAVPSPLAIGSLELIDGRVVQGFVCEAWATQGARDITAFGGWRAYLREQQATTD